MCGGTPCGCSNLKASKALQVLAMGGYIYLYIYTHMEMRPAIKYCQFLKQEPSIDARLDGIA